MKSYTIHTCRPLFPQIGSKEIRCSGSFTVRDEDEIEISFAGYADKLISWCFWTHQKTRQAIMVTVKRNVRQSTLRERVFNTLLYGDSRIGLPDSLVIKVPRYKNRTITGEFSVMGVKR